jgi:hypothetical protein
LVKICFPKLLIFNAGVVVVPFSNTPLLDFVINPDVVYVMVYGSSNTTLNGSYISIARTSIFSWNLAMCVAKVFNVLYAF